MKNYILLLLFVTTFLTTSATEIALDATPVIGGQVIIEKGQSHEEIDALFAMLRNSDMPICRIRMFESYMCNEQGKWDFSLFDYAFESAQRNNVKIIATLFPYTEFTDIGGFKFPRTDKHLKSIANYIKQVTTHFKSAPALYGWVLMNEIGSGSAPIKQDFSAKKFAQWQKTDTLKAFNANGYPIMTFQKERFLVDYNTWYLQWLSTEVKKYDTTHHLHVNTHAIYDTYPEYNFTKWRGILDSFGGSAHASWHFGKFTRDKYPYAMSANAEIIRSGAGNKPWIMTEVQGGNNIWSGGIPLCPTKEEIEQWMWTVIGGGGKGLVFWSLNARSSGIEAGEWSLLDFYNRPTDRMTMAAKTASIVKKYADVFATAKVEESGVTILYTRESNWCEKSAETAGQFVTGRAPGAAILSAIGFYETLSQMGVQCNIKCIDEYDFNDENVTDKVIILPHQISLPAKYISSLNSFAVKGGFLLVEGLTGYYDENMHLQYGAKCPYRDTFGGFLTEFPLIKSSFNIELKDSTNSIPAHAWEGRIQTEHSAALAINKNGNTLISMNNYGTGKVFWLPSCVGIAARETNNYKPLADFLTKNILPQISNNSLRFKTFTDGVLMKNIKTNKGRIVVLINKNISKIDLEISLPATAKGIVINSNDSIVQTISNTVTLLPEETKVIFFEQQN